jgi:hypothetical protein
LVLTTTSLLAAASADLFWLTVSRTFSGLALGAYPPLIVAYLCDVLPPRQRGRMILVCCRRPRDVQRDPAALVASIVLILLFGPRGLSRQPVE